MRAQCLAADVRPGLRHDERDDRLAHFASGGADDRGLRHANHALRQASSSG
jgi:hypothetical protein